MRAGDAEWILAAAVTIAGRAAVEEEVESARSAEVTNLREAIFVGGGLILCALVGRVGKELRGEEKAKEGGKDGVWLRGIGEPERYVI